MNPDMIRRSIEASFVSNNKIDLVSMSVVIQEKARSLVETGIELDADAICYVFRTGDDSLAVIIAVGRSMLMGPEAYQWIMDYHNLNTAAAKRCIDRIVEYAIEDIPTTGECSIPFKDTKNKAWRSFKVRQPEGTVKSIDEVRKSAFLKLGRKTN